MLHFDFRYSPLSFFLTWGALILSLVASGLFIFNRPRYQTITIAMAALALWTAGALVPVLT